MVRKDREDAPVRRRDDPRDGTRHRANNALALRRIKEFRKLRNLLGHFAVKRFPAEDALVFVTKSAADYKRVLGAAPDPGVVMTAVADLTAGSATDVSPNCRAKTEVGTTPRANHIISSITIFATTIIDLLLECPGPGDVSAPRNIRNVMPGTIGDNS
jgi:hypothetical protein